MLPTSAQIVAARALLLMEQRTLADLADVHVSTLVRIEAAGWKVAPGNASTIDRIVSVLERKGIEFIENGVRLTKKPRR